ncbi:hypothetical protein AB0M02_42100 [Actinoplanes sp. NPDC051861]|uniref:hypothetical protein n=1 Tax=Actinoplanes sp. NPDC051861 TaxID=3155170 RepID=UPI003442B37F
MDVRGGLDDALDKLARRDELRRRATGETPGTPPAVTELVEAIAGVISRNPNLSVTVGVEGAGEPTLLHFAFADGVVQVSADHSVAARATEAAPRHADFEIDIDDQTEEPPAEPPRASLDDQDRFGPTDFAYTEPPTAERPYVTPTSPAGGYQEFATPPNGQPVYGYQAESAAEEVGTHPFAAPPPPPVPPQTQHAYASAPPPQPHPYAATPPPPAYSDPPMSGVPYSAPHAEPAAPPYSAPHIEPASVHPSAPGFPEPPAPSSGFPEPLAQPIPLQVERPEETEMAARRLAAMLRDDPTLLDDPHHQ